LALGSKTFRIERKSEALRVLHILPAETVLIKNISFYFNWLYFKESFTIYETRRLKSNIFINKKYPIFLLQH
jgi:hypothetical protein